MHIVALVGDVHANLPALEAVLAHAQSQKADALWNVGDFIGYGAYPNQVIKRLRMMEAVSILGNYDLKVLKIKRKKKKWRKKRLPQKLLAFEWAHDELSKKNRRYLKSLPKEVRFEILDRRVLLTHGSPESNEELLTPETPNSRLRDLALIAEADLVIFGHSHQPFARKVAGTWFINTGSVGRQDDGDPRAAYAVLRLSEEIVEVEHFRVAYDVERMVKEIRKKGLPEEFAQMFIRGLPLEEVEL
jgi:putative phosphoesterase